MTESAAEELERFRQQWQQEVEARSRKPTTASTSKSTRLARPSQSHGVNVPRKEAGSSYHKPYRDPEEYDGLGDRSYHDLVNKDERRKLGEAGERSHPSSGIEPSSALEHYERAVERESEGSLGDSLSHYRKAFRLDAGVDRIYKNKHFPPSSFPSKPTNPNASNAPVTVPNPAHHSLDGPPTSSISDLIASFSSISITPTQAPTDASPSPPCPISSLPSEILINILFQTAIIDVASFARLSLVCKRFAYLVATEDRIWRRVCLGAEVGFEGMHYKWARTISGDPIPISIDEHDEEDISADLSSLTLYSQLPTTNPFTTSEAYPTYKHMLHTRPRLRFNGCYISTVNYIRPGGNTASQATWNTPVHIVTYYRYLRFFRDGTCAHLLTTTEPSDVVHYLTKENLHSHHAGGLPSSVMNHCLRGRWKLSGDPYRKSVQPSREGDDEGEGILHVETEGADIGQPQPKYFYKMILSLRSTGRGAGATRNNKLAWMGYWSYNKLTDDWAEFGLKNDKAFFWSRVKSYGTGE